MQSQKKLIHIKQWDYLIVLDACRFDFFNKVYGKYIEGDLRKVISPETETVEWCKNVFPDKYDDIVYISGNPWINSKFKLRGYKAKKHFHKVEDVWNWGWSKNLGTVLPKKLCSAVSQEKKENPSKRFIVHYMQPHAPYLNLQNLKWESYWESHKQKNSEKKPRLPHKKINSWIWWKMGDLLGMERTSKIRGVLNLPPLTLVTRALRKVGRDGLRKSYFENLETCLKSIANCNELNSENKEVIVTSDHGELLGEGKMWGHGFQKRLELVKVPWLEVHNMKVQVRSKNL